MGNCSTGRPSNKILASPRSFDLGDQAAGPIMTVETTKKQFVEEFREEEKKQVDENLKRNEKRGNFKIKQGADQENEPLYEHIQKVKKIKSKEDIQFIIGSLKKTFLFYNLSETELEQVVNAMFYCEVKEQEFIFKQGDNASSYFILAKGRLELIVNNDSKKYLSVGEGFGELALLYSAPRSASIKTTEKSGLWGIDRVTFRNVVEQLITKEYSENRKFLDAVAFFSNLLVQN